MDELQLFLALVILLLAWVAFVLLYRAGGWLHKALRRWLGGLLLPVVICGVSLWLRSFSWWMVLSVPLFPLWLSQGYGGDTTPIKFRRRAIYALWASLAVAPILLPAGLVGLWLMQSALALAVSVALGLRNPISATGEESVIGGASTLIATLSVLR